MKLSVVVITWNSGKVVRECLSSVIKHTNVDSELVVIDNNSSDDTVEIVKVFPTVKLIANKENLGLAKAYNQAAKICTGGYVAFLNADVLFLEDSLSKMADFLDKNPEFGGVACFSRSGDGKPMQEAFRRQLAPFNLFLNDFFFTIFNRIFPGNRVVHKLFSISCSNMSQEVQSFAAACMMFRADIVRRVPFDEQFFVYYAEPDYCFMLRKLGFKVYFLADTALIHYGAQSTQLRDDRQKLYQKDYTHFLRKNYGSIAVFSYALLRPFILLINRVAQRFKSSS